MKKTYIIPEMEVVKIQIQQMLAASPNGAYDEQGSGTQLSREFEFDDEEY